ncbi:MAG TPA: extracellular solute-binding protein, partial [Actinoplanes sp.]
MQQMQAGYEKSHPNIPLQAVTLAWGNPYYTKLSLATVGGKPPNVAVAHLTRMKILQEADLLQELHPDDLARNGMTPEKFNKRAWEAGLVDGKIYAIPIDTHPWVLFYNTKICGQAGLLDGAGKLKTIQGPDAFIDALTKVKQVTGQYGATHGINADTATPWRFFQTLYSQLGGEVLAENGTKVVLDDAKAKQVLDFMKSLTVDKKLMP